MTIGVTTEDILAWLHTEYEEARPQVDDQGWIHSGIRCTNIALNFFLRCDKDQEILYMMAAYPQRIPDNKIVDLNELLVRINGSASRGKSFCTWNREVGVIEWNNHIFLSGPDFPAKILKRVFDDCLYYADAWYPAFMAVIYGGKTGEEAYTLSIEPS